MSGSPTQRSLALLRERGYVAQVVEHWNPFAKRRVDLFGCIDIVAVGNGETVGVQATSYANTASRVKKVANADAVVELRRAGWRLIVMGWRKVKNRWVVREVNCS